MYLYNIIMFTEYLNVSKLYITSLLKRTNECS